MAGINALTESESQGGLVLIAGGTDKGTELGEVAKLIEQKCSKVHLLEGSGTDKLLPLLPGAQVHKLFASTVLSAIGDVDEGDILLFSPLFSSFGKEFTNEYDRGDKFKKIIKEYYES
jgi:UDP-N-acetylmuramoylalanine-D-glutamate ligase